MSLWGATVITNLLSAIPWVGQDIVEFVWGGLYTDEPYYGNVILKILLIAGTSIIIFIYVLTIIISYVKIIKIKRKSAGVKKLHTFEASQRLHAEDLIYAYIVGLIEGDGYFSITKKGKYLTYELGIELSIKDVQLIHKIKNILGIGIISYRTKNNHSMVSLRIRNKDHLIKYIIPIFDKYTMFSNKQYDYLRFRINLLSNIIYSEYLPDYTRSNNNLNSVNNIINAPYFSAWLVGFIEAEGCFTTYKLNNINNYPIASFDIAQKGGEILISAIQKYLSFTTKIHLDKNNCYKLKVTSVRSISNIINFIDKAPVKLLGNKKLQYLLWIKQLRTIPRYSQGIKIPLNY